MIFDHRSYTCKPGTIKAHVELYKNMGLGPQSRHLGAPVMWATTEVGDVNSYVHIWAYKSLDQRMQIRADAAKKGVWPPPGSADRLFTQESKILMPASWSPLQ